MRAPVAGERSVADGVDAAVEAGEAARLNAVPTALAVRPANCS